MGMISGLAPPLQNTLVRSLCIEEGWSAVKGLLRELTARKRNRLFSYAGYVEIMNRGTELPGR